MRDNSADLLSYAYFLLISFVNSDNLREMEFEDLADDLFGDEGYNNEEEEMMENLKKPVNTDPEKGISQKNQ